MAPPKGKFDRIQMRFSPEKNLLDAFCVSILANCALSPSALFKALLLRYGMEDMGGVGLNPEAQAYIVAVHPKAANKDAAGHMPVGELASEMEAREQTPKKKQSAEVLSGTPRVAPAPSVPTDTADTEQLVRRPASMDLSGFDREEFLKANRSR